MDAELFDHSVAFWVAATVVGVLGTARLVRLLVFDSFPPAAWVRAGWDRITRDGTWSQLVHCGYCAAPWIAAGTIAWGWASAFHWSWWLFFGFLALSYAASIVVAWDEPPGPD